MGFFTNGCKLNRNWGNGETGNRRNGEMEKRGIGETVTEELYFIT